MKIALLSDTHIPMSTNKLPQALLKELKTCDMIIHAGDLCEPSVIEDLSAIAKTEAVCGNMDSPKIKRELPVKKIIQAGKFRIGVTHGHGAPDKVLENVQLAFAGEKLDCVVYGHSHGANVQTIGNTIYINPGSPTDDIFAPYNSYGIILIDDDDIDAKIVRMEK